MSTHLSGADYSKIGPLLQHTMNQESKSGMQKQSGISFPKRFPLLIETSDPDEIKQMNLPLRLSTGAYLTASLTYEQIMKLSKSQSIKRMEIGAPCHYSLDMSLPAIGADRLHAGETGTVYKGENVVIGIIDSGIDWQHDDFIAENGSTRILSIWDQIDTSNTPPFSYNYGSYYSRQDIQNELDGVVTGFVKGKDVWGHGTHVAGIAAGNGRAGQNGKNNNVYVGVAPEASLIIVKGGDYTAPTSDRIIDGLDFILREADAWSISKVVVNLSLGTHLGPHDGTSLFEKAISNLFNSSDQMMVVAAGNERNDNIHAMGILDGPIYPDTLSFSLKVPENNMNTFDYLRMNIWYTGSAQMEVFISTPSGAIYGPIADMDSIREYTTQEGYIYFDNASDGIEPENKDKQALLEIRDVSNNGISQDNLAPGKWTINFIGDSARIDAWIYDPINSPIQFISRTDVSTLIVEPGNSPFTMTVASYNTRESWPGLSGHPNPPSLTIDDISVFSSPGPVRPSTLRPDPLRKPEIAAPGSYIVSSLSSFMAPYPARYKIVNDSAHYANSGTSFAAPHVTGAVALLMNANPLMTVSDINYKLIRSATQDSWTGAVWNPDWGYGKLDVYTAVSASAITGEVSFHHPEEITISQNYPNPFNPSTQIHYQIYKKREMQIDVFNAQGQRIRTLFHGVRHPGLYTLEWDGQNRGGDLASSGLYVIQFKSKTQIQHRKMLLIR